MLLHNLGACFFFCKEVKIVVLFTWVYKGYIGVGTGFAGFLVWDCRSSISALVSALGFVVVGFRRSS